ncbi:MAG TPA: CPBP family intramembrane glutamic endopeptidase [Cyclobacteriaceae bacterium]
MFETGDHSRSPFVTLILLLIGVCLGFVVVGPLVGFLVTLPFYEGSMVDLAEALQNPMEHPDIKLPLYVLQGSATLIGLIVTPVLLLKAFGRSVRSLFIPLQLYWIPVLLTPVIVVSFIGINSWLVEWNAGLHLPETLKGIEEWARLNEDHRIELTAFLTNFSSTGELFVALLVIAVIPAIGEELVFRGLIQNELYRLTQNAHAAVWLAALLFSAFHLQFFGFFPRLLLGSLFGYMYYWSGSLVIAILAHFVNNCFVVLSLYFYQRGDLSIPLEETESLPGPALMLSAALTLLLLFYFRKFYNTRSELISR